MFMTMNRKMIAVSAVFAATLLTAAGCTFSLTGKSVEISSPFAKSIITGVDTTVAYGVDRNFRELEVSGFYKIVYTDSVDSVVVTCDKALIPYVAIENRKDELLLAVKPISLKNAEKISALVPLSLVGLESVDLSGACTFDTESVIAGQKLDVELSGASRFEAGVEVRELDVDMSGACNAAIDGSAEKVEADGSGAIRLDCRELKAGYVKAEMSGATRCEFNTDVLDAEVSGASKVYVNKDAKVSVDASGASKVERY